ncbi:MAG: hypothetical protein K5Q00_01400 [Gammaproteobacteria bacterium]|nr:hypothetical protein [Gammaproteobacteria bacterium]
MPVPIPPLPSAATAMALVHEQDAKVCEFCKRQNSVRKCRLVDNTHYWLCGACTQSYGRNRQANQQQGVAWLSSWIENRKAIAETAPLRGQKNGMCSVCGFESYKCGNRNFFGVICYGCDACARAHRRIKNKAATSLDTWKAERIAHAREYNKSWI